MSSYNWKPQNTGDSSFSLRLSVVFIVSISIAFESHRLIDLLSIWVPINDYITYVLKFALSFSSVFIFHKFCRTRRK
jgi:hypothetical protein